MYFNFKILKKSEMFTICINIIRELLDFTDLYSFNRGGKREKKPFDSLFQ